MSERLLVTDKICTLYTDKSSEGKSLNKIIEEISKEMRITESQAKNILIREKCITADGKFIEVKPKKTEKAAVHRNIKKSEISRAVSAKAQVTSKEDMLTAFKTLKEKDGVPAVYSCVKARYKELGYSSAGELSQVLYDEGILKKCGRKKSTNNETKETKPAIKKTKSCSDIDVTIADFEQQQRELSGQISKLQLRQKEIADNIKLLSEAKMIIDRNKKSVK